MKIWIAVIPTSEVSKRELLFRLRHRSGRNRWQFGIELGTHSGYQHYQCRYETSNGDYEVERRYWCGIKLELQEAGGWSNYELKDGCFYSYLDDQLGKYRFSRLKDIQLCILAKGRHTDDRQIVIVVDKLGGVTGKTFLARWCSLNGKGYYIDGTDTKGINRNVYDTIQCDRGHKEYQFHIDLTRNDKMDAGLFKQIETIKNGYLSDGRYQFVYQWIVPPKIWIYTNHEPEWDKLSKDRWVKMFIKESKDGKILLWDRREDGTARTRTFNRNN